jgi:ABC-type nitrate/sulfonate/bicarbonate transport system substrate-binding protein
MSTTATLPPVIETPGTLWYTRCPVPTAVGIAVQQGRIAAEFARDGLIVKSLRDNEDRSIRESHYDHKLLNSFRQGGSIPAIWARAQGRDTRVIGLTWTDEYQAVVAAPRSGIRNVRDLKGRKIGLPRRDEDIIDFPRAMALRGVDTSLTIAGLSLAEVELVYFQRAQALGDSIRSQPEAGKGDVGWQPTNRRESPEFEALLRGEVDAIYLKGARALGLVEQHGLTVLTDLNTHPDPIVRSNNGTPRPLTVDGHLARTRPDVVRRILSQVIAASTWAEGHAIETREFIAREVGSTPELVRRAYGDELHRHLGVGLEAVHVAGFKAFTAFLHQHGFIGSQVDVDAWIDPAPLAELARSATAKAVA